MKNAAQCEKGLKALLKKIVPAELPPLEFADNPVSMLIYGFMLWESSSEKALAAHASLTEDIVDFNDLRVSMPHEMEAAIGVRYPRATDRCQRLRATLRDLYNREHGMTMESVSGLGKRDARKYLESLDGIPPFVASFVMLRCFDIHAVPVDEQMRVELIDVGAADPSAEVVDLATWMTRQIKAADSSSVQAALQLWMDGLHGKRRTRKTTTRKKKTTTRSSKKTSSRKTTTRKSTAGKTSRKKKTTKK